MTTRREIPELASELFDLSKKYLKQETVGAAKRLGRQAGFGLIAGLLLAIGLAFLVIASYGFWAWLLPTGQWWIVLARFLTLLTSGVFLVVIISGLARD